MEIFVTSIIDLEKTTNSRLHQFLKILSNKHNITVLSINDQWKGNLNKNIDNSYLNKINILHLTEKKYSPIIQEYFSPFFINKILDKREMEKIDVHLNYGTIKSGYHIDRKYNKNFGSIYDIADDFSSMIRTSPQLPKPLGYIGGIVGDISVKKTIDYSTKVILTTKSLKELYNIDDKKGLIIPNGVDVDFFRDNVDPSPKTQMYYEEGALVVGFVGNLREWVDLEPAFRAIKMLREGRKKVKMFVVGDEGGLNKYKKIVKELRLEEDIIFFGTINYNEVPSYISAMDVCLIPFKNDAVSNHSLPLKLFEYMSCGKVVISSPIGGVINEVGDQVLYASTSEEYYNHLSILYNNKTSIRDLGRSNREFVLKNYDWAILCNRLENMMKTLAL